MVNIESYSYEGEYMTDEDKKFILSIMFPDGMDED